ncbi:hypothetical protein Tco_1243560 [Tanacetum coccineum]
MPTEMELTLEQTQQGVSYEVSNIRVNSFTMKMEILLEPTSNKLMVGRPHESEGYLKWWWRSLIPAVSQDPYTCAIPDRQHKVHHESQVHVQASALDTTNLS